MEENVALDTTKQKKFDKSIKGIKKLIKKKETQKSEEVITPKSKEGKAKRNRPDRGLVYLSHIPHGFYEHEMSQYFKQFGMVTNVRVIRSKRTGNSKGFAFVEFKEPAVAEIVAETMNNYLMGKRLIKAAYVPPEKQRPKAMRKHWSRLNNPGREGRLKNKKAHNENKDDVGNLKKARKIISNINKTKKKLSEMGINYDFFTPVDIPEALQNSLQGKDNADVTNQETKPIKEQKSQMVKDSKDSVKKEKSIEKPQSKITLEKNQKAPKVEIPKPIKSEAKNKVKKENKKEQEPVNKKDQKQKQQKLKDAGVSPPENYIKVQEGSEDSDSSMEFDSDEYEKMLEDDESDVGDDSGENDGDDSEEDDGSDEEEEIAPPPKKTKGKPALILAKSQSQKQAKKSQGPPEQVKRKAPQKSPQSPKKPKFEKQSQRPLKKQFKKKK